MGFGILDSKVIMVGYVSGLILQINNSFFSHGSNPECSSIQRFLFSNTIVFYPVGEGIQIVAFEDFDFSNNDSSSFITDKSYLEEEDFISVY